MKLKSVKQRICFREARYNDLDGPPNIIGCRFVLDLKKTVVKNVRAWTPFFAQGHKEVEKTFIIHDSVTLKNSS